MKTMKASVRGMACPLRVVRLGDEDTIYVTRSMGRKCQEDVVAAVTDLPDGGVVLLDFRGVDVVDYSFADEAIGKVVARITSGEFDNRYLAITGLSEHLKENIEVSLEQRKLAVSVIDDADGCWGLLGYVKDHLKSVYMAVVEREGVTARDVSSLFDIALNNASNRLIELNRMHLIKREEEPLKGGGKQFVYKRLIEDLGCI